MSIKARLDRLTGEKTSTVPADPDAQGKQEKISDLRRRIDSVIERRPVHRNRIYRPLTEVIADSEEANTSLGKVVVFHGRYHRGAFHGCKRIGDLTNLSTGNAAILGGHPAISEFNFQDALFLDTETTGLSGGSGTMPFLIGLGWYEGEAFITRQLFARDFGEESALLSYLTELAGDKRFLITFNGRAFDMNLLSVRYILNRMKDPFSGMPHIDLLHPSRRMLGHRLENSRLVTIEEKVLLHVRDGDIPGHEIPQRYFDWLRSRNPALMMDVLEHNRLDVVSMAALLLHLCEILDYGIEAEGACHSDVLATSRFFLERGERDRGMRMLQSLQHSEDSFCRNEARRNLSLQLKKDGKWDQAVSLWEQMFAEVQDGFAMVELAKWYEHKLFDFEKAAHLVCQALTNETDQETRAGLTYRLERIRRRISVAGRKKKRNDPKGD